MRFWPFLLIAVMVFRCTKCEEKAEYSLHESSKPLINTFPVGNWWVYLNQDSTIQDSIWVSAYHGWNFQQDERCYTPAVNGFFEMDGTYAARPVGELNLRYYLGDVSDQDSEYNQFGIASSSLTLPTFKGLAINAEGDVVITSVDSVYSATRKDTVVNGNEYKQVIILSNGFPFLSLEKGFLGYYNQTDTFRLIKSSLLESR